jgi:uncharacterized protein YidB (DUF937 family)
MLVALIVVTLGHHAKEDDMGKLVKSIFGLIGLGAFGLAEDIVNQYIEKHGGVDGVIRELEKTGYGQQVSSWLSKYPNLPISADQIQHALGSHYVKELAAKFDIPVDKAALLLATHLPIAIDKAAPEGTLVAAATPRLEEG